MRFRLGRFLREKELFDSYRRKEGLKKSAKQQEILEAFLSMEGHVTPEALRDILLKRGSQVDIKTVKDALGLMVDAGIASELMLDDGKIYYEHIFAHRHHDHLVCRHCGQIAEFSNPEIEKLQEEIAKSHEFAVDNHRLVIYGVCKRCSSKVRVETPKVHVKKKKFVSLVDMKPGESGIIVEISGGYTLIRHLAALGIRKGKEITKVSTMIMGGPVVVSIDGRQLAIGYGMAARVNVSVD